MVWKISEEELKKQAPVVQERLKDKDAGIKKYRPAQDVDTYRDTSGGTPQPKTRWERIREGIQRGGEKGYVKAKEYGRKGLDKVQEYNRNQLDKEKKERKERPEKRERRPASKEPKGRVSSRDIYKDGVLQERIHYGPSAKPAKQPKSRRGRRDDPLGGIGAGMSFRDMMPRSNQGFGLGGMMSEPYGAPAPRPRKGKKGRRQPQEEPFDYLNHMNNMPDSWKGLF